METIRVRLAKREDCDSIARLRQELVIYNATQSQTDKFDECFPVSAEGLAKDGFDGATPYFKCLLAEVCDSGSGKSLAVGYALYYYTYGGFHGRALYLEDMCVSENYRRHGVGSAIFKSLGKICVKENLARMTLDCYDWNKSAQSFYERHGGYNRTKVDKFNTYVIESKALKDLAV